MEKWGTIMTFYEFVRWVLFTNTQIVLNGSETVSQQWEEKIVKKIDIFLQRPPQKKKSTFEHFGGTALAFPFYQLKRNYTNFT